eukprot:Plantae.Rhodophyta-Purpureofilum_apyrenoidigerum.ctg275.p2 GENE.Plantae.Rhodophyta-Purpureofilum_apyrenoidigerum.ctg275~~Plantae.Rhodophyta-Purpureofilum_apyrenoidigerum.ctg275.p2  ORF type:complete len:344 (-),score=95.17 Plantae.Rhodophyta-Purpureofilum_apyrenoidigerum.ctg275:1493-2524(-)
MSQREKRARIPRGRDLFKDALAQSESVTVANNVNILEERPWVFAEYGKSWALDSFAVTHNAVRAELGDLYGLVVSMVKRKDAVAHEDIENFFVWWQPFSNFIVQALNLELSLIFPPLETRVALAGPVSGIRREQLMEEVKEQVAKISAKVSTFRDESPKTILGDLIQFVDCTVVKIIAMFETAESETVQYMLSHKDLEFTQTQFFEEVSSYALKQEDPQKFAILWQRGFQSTEQRRYFKDFFLKYKKKKKKLFFNMKKWVEAYEQAEEQIEKTHFAAVREFWRAWRMADAYLNINEADIKLPIVKKAKAPAQNVELIEDEGYEENEEATEQVLDVQETNRVAA